MPTTLGNFIGVEVHVQPGFFDDTREQRTLFRKYRKTIADLKSNRGYDLDRLARWLADLEIAQTTRTQQLERDLRYYREECGKYQDVITKQRGEIHKLRKELLDCARVLESESKK